MLQDTRQLLSRGKRSWIDKAFFRAASVSSTVSRTGVWTELETPPAPSAHSLGRLALLAYSTKSPAEARDCRAAEVACPAISVTSRDWQRRAIPADARPRPRRGGRVVPLRAGGGNPGSRLRKCGRVADAQPSTGRDDLGTKVTYVHKDMKVIFVDGKVSDVQ